MDLTLYKVGASGRVALAGLAAGVEFYSATKDEATGVVTLTPVRIVSATAGRRPDAQEEGPDDVGETRDAPWDQ